MAGITAKIYRVNQDHHLKKNAGLPSIHDSKNEPEIWQAFLKGDRSAFIFIYNRYFKVLYGYGRQFTDNNELIKDIIHDVFLDLQTTREKLSPTSSIRFYLLRCFKNRYLRYLKKKQKEDPNLWQENGLQFEAVLSVEQRMIQDQLGAEQLQKVNKALQNLTKRQKEAVFYFYYQELTIDQIREIMNLDNRRSVQNLIYQAIGELKQVLLQVILLIMIRPG